MYKNKECCSGLLSFISIWNHVKKKVTKPPIQTILLLSRPWNTKKILVRKIIGAKKIQIFLLKLMIQKNFLDPSGDNPGFSHIDVIFIRKVKARFFSQKWYAYCSRITLYDTVVTRYGTVVTRPPHCRTS